MGIGVFIGISSVLLTIGALLIFGATRDPLLKFFDWIFHWTGVFLDIMPKPLKILMFLFFLIFIVGGVVNLFLSMLFFCDGTTVYQPDSFFTGVGIAIGSIIEDSTTYGNLTNSQYNALLNDNAFLYSTPSDMTPEGLIQVQCLTNTPRLTVFGINIFDYRTWIILLIFGGFITLYFKLKH